MTKNVCIVGYGSIGPTHAAAIEKTENAKFYAVCDNNPKRIDFCKKQYNVKSFSDFDEMILDTNIDSVHICTPHYLHFEMIKKALKAGKTVVCEKPVTMTRAEFNELLTLEGADRVCVSLQNRFNPCFQKLREIIEKGELGNIKAVKGIVTWYRTPDYYLADKWRGKWATEGGGVIINQAIHLLDYLCLIGGKPEAVAANIMNFDLPEIEVEDSCAAHISFKNGVKGILFATNSYRENSPAEFEVLFEKGIIRYIDSKLYVNEKLLGEDSKPSLGKEYWGIGHEALMKSFYDFNKGLCPHDIIDTMEVLFAIYESANNNGEKIML